MFRDYYISNINREVQTKAVSPVKPVSDRLPALDLARCVAMFMMIQGHVLFELTHPSYINIHQFPWDIWEFFRGLTAPIFLTVSGAVQVFANKRDEKGNLSKNTIRKRINIASLLILIGYFLVFPASKFYHLLVMPSNGWTGFFQVNILQLIGVSLLLVLVLFVMTKDNKIFGKISFFIGLAILLITPIMHIINWFNYLPEIIAPYISQLKGSIFTIFPFTGFIFIGAAFGSYLKQIPAENRNKTIIRIGLIMGVIFISAGIPLYFYIKAFNINFIEPYKSNTGMAFIRTGCVFSILSLVTILYEKIKKYSKYFSLFGKRALFIYIVHLVILYGSPWTRSIGQVFHQSMPLYLSSVVALIIIAISVGMAYYYDYSVKKNPNMKLFYKYSILTLMAYLIFV